MREERVHMTLLKAIIMGIIQGVAEFLPVSSSGHLAILKHILNIDLENGGLLFDVEYKHRGYSSSDKS